MTEKQWALLCRFMLTALRLIALTAAKLEVEIAQDVRGDFYRLKEDLTSELR